MTDFWKVPTFEEVKSRKYTNPSINIGLRKYPYLSHAIKMDTIKFKHLLETPSKHQASKKGYRHAQGKRKPVHLLGRKTLKIEKEKK